MKPRKDNLESGFTLIETIITLVMLSVVVAMMAQFFGTSFIQSVVPISRLTAASNLNQVMETITNQYSKFPHWRPATTYASGAIVLPTTPSRTGLLYITSSSGTSGATEPIWPTSSATPVVDGTVNPGWTMNVAAPTLVLNKWLANTGYTVNTVVVRTASNPPYQYICTAAGKTGATEPAWPTGSGSTVTDGPVTPVTWKQIGPVPTLILQNDIGAEGGDFTNGFGSYRVIQNRFIKFNASSTEVNIDPLYGGASDPLYGQYLKVTIGFRSDASNRTGETLTTLFTPR